MLKYDRYEWGYKLLVAYIYILLFGSWVMKMVGIPESLGFALLAVLDVIPFGIWVLSNPCFRVKTNEIFVDTLKFWVLWLLLLGLLIASGIRHGGAIVPSIVHWGALVRYIPLAFIVLSLGRHINIEDRIIKHFKFLSIILVFVGYLCILLGSKATFFLPLLPNGSSGEKEILNGYYSAVFANTIDLAFILIVLYTIFIYRKGISQLKMFFLTLIFFIVIFRTGSSIATCVFLFIAFFRLTQEKKVLRYSLITTFVLLTVFLGYIYWDLIILVVDNAKLSRLGMLMLTLPDFLSEFSIDTFWGIGNDGYVVLNKVNGYKEQVHLLAVATDGNISAFGDVYWLALLVYHGLIGLGIICYIYYSLYKATIKNTYIDNKFDYSRIIRRFFFSIIILAFLNQVVVVKTFAIVFWIFLAIVYNKIQRDENTTTK